MYGVRCVLIENPLGDRAEEFSMELRGEPSITGRMKRRKVKKKKVYIHQQSVVLTQSKFYVFSFNLGFRLAIDIALSH